MKREARGLHGPPQARAVEAFGMLPREWHEAIAEYTSHRGDCLFYEGEPCSCSVETFRSSLYVIVAAHLGLISSQQGGA